MKIMFVVNDLGVNEPFGPMILSAVLKKHGHETILGVLKKEDVGKKIENWKPDILAYSMMSVDMKEMKAFNDDLRAKRKIFTVLGGPHATLDRDCVKDPNIDAICVGEGEDAIVDLVKKLEGGRPINDIPNILTASSTELKLRGLIEDLDAYPFMDREIVYTYPEMGRFGIKGIWTSRGCAFPCPYCFNNRQNRFFKDQGRVVRRRSVGAVIEETKKLIKGYRADFIRIQDDVFVYKADEWLKEFADRWSLEIKLPFYCLLRAELITEEMAFYLKKAGCFSVCMSIESGDDEIRMRMMRRKATKDQLEDAFRILKSHKINVYANTMLALPFTTLQQDIASLDFVIKVKPEMPNFSIFMPYTGTDLGDYCKNSGIYDPQKDDISYGMRNMSPLKCFKKEEMEAQYNLCELAIIAVKFPALRNIIVNKLIHWKPNKIFFLAHYFFAVTSYGTKIFYFRHSFLEYIDLLFKTFKHYLYDFTKKEKKDAGRSSKIEEEYIEMGEEERAARFKECADAMANSRVYDPSC